jgi:hypothetical protein
MNNIYILIKHILNCISIELLFVGLFLGFELLIDESLNPLLEFGVGNDQIHGQRRPSERIRLVTAVNVSNN